MSIDKEGNVYDIDNLIEKLAALEHEQWAHWTRYMLDNLTPENIQRWRRQIETPYEDLSEKEKESDRVWARKVMELTGKPTYGDTAGQGISKRHRSQYAIPCITSRANM